MHSDLTFPVGNTLVLDVDAFRSASHQADQPFLLVNGQLNVAGALVLYFGAMPTTNALEVWPALRTNTGKIEGQFASISSRFSSNLLDQAEKLLCMQMELRRSATATQAVMNITSQLHNTCVEHPGRTAAIVCSVLGTFFAAITLFVLWRKRRFERSRAAVLSSPLADEAEQEMQAVDKSRYAETAKMIESTSGRFEIGDDDDMDEPDV